MNTTALRRSAAHRVGDRVTVLRRALRTVWFRGQLGPSREADWFSFSPRPR